jgi:cold shock CspA family protein
MELKVEGRNLDLRKSWQEKIEEEKERLMRHHPGLVFNLRVTLEATSHQKQGGYKVGIVAGVPNDTVVVKKKGESVRPLLIDAFDKLGYQLKELQRKRRQTNKVAEPAEVLDNIGKIKSLSPFESYGFITTVTGQDVYFHENALKDLSMDDLSEGDKVSFGVTEGDKGPQATWVRSA